MLIAAPRPPVHWTTYVQTFAVIASMVGTFVYVYFTYHIMKWAVGQGQAAVEVSRLTIEEAGLRKAMIGDKLRSVLSEIGLMCEMFPLLDSEYAAVADRWTSEANVRSLLGRIDKLRNMSIGEELRPPLGQLRGQLELILEFRRSAKGGAGDQQAALTAAKYCAGEAGNLARELLRAHFGVELMLPGSELLQEY